MRTAVGASPRQSAQERRAAVLPRALEHFATAGYYAASTAKIARDAGISHGYLFRLFATKAELFLACHREHCAWTRALLAHAAASADGDPFAAMAASYARAAPTHRFHLLFQIQSYACTEPEIRAAVASAFEGLVEQLTLVSGSTPGHVLRSLQSLALLDVLTTLASPLTCQSASSRDPQAGAHTCQARNQ